MQKIYTIYDKKTQSFSSTIFTTVNDSSAVRIMSMTVSRDEMLFKYAEDFDLYMIGQLDHETGKITSNKPDFIINVSAIRSEFIKQQEKENEEAIN